MSLRAIKNKVIAEEVIEEEKEPENGIILPDSSKPKSSTLKCVVTSVGGEVKDVKVGDVLLLPNWVKPAQIGQKVFYVTDESEIIGVVTE